jgi:hypothetical protein
MKRTYIQPSAKTYPADYDLDLMIPVGSEGVDDGFAKERKMVEIETEFPPRDEWKESLW